MNKLVKIAEMRRRVFTARDLAVLWGYADEKRLYELIKYYVREKKIFVLARGLYATRLYTEKKLRGDSELLLEVANKLVPNSYVSLFTVLRQSGVVSQYYDEVYCVASRSVVREVMGVEFVYKQVKDEILFNDFGVKIEGGVRVASLERAVADTWYVYPKLNLENLEQVNRGELGKIVRMYGKKVMQEKLKNITADA